jgi:hypothetical protein
MEELFDKISWESGDDILSLAEKIAVSQHSDKVIYIVI